LSTTGTPIVAAIGVQSARGNRVRGNRGHRSRGNRGHRSRGHRGGNFRGHRGGFRGSRGFHGKGFRGRGFRGRHFNRGFRGSRFGYSGYGYGRRGFHRRGFTGADAFFLGAGVVGTAILIDRAHSNRRQFGSYDNTRSVGSSTPSLRSQGKSLDSVNGDREVLIGGLEGNYQPAYNACLRALTSQLKSRGIEVTADKEPISGGSIGEQQWRFNGEFVTKDERGGTFLRTLTCEASKSTVSYLEIG